MPQVGSSEGDDLQVLRLKVHTQSQAVEGGWEEVSIHHQGVPSCLQTIRGITFSMTALIRTAAAGFVA